MAENTEEVVALRRMTGEQEEAVVLRLLSGIVLRAERDKGRSWKVLMAGGVEEGVCAWLAAALLAMSRPWQKGFSKCTREAMD